MRATALKSLPNNKGVFREKSITTFTVQQLKETTQELKLSSFPSNHYAASAK